jgi:two-component system, cell cycle sensor histidine kinase and response regulator CckA
VRDKALPLPVVVLTGEGDEEAVLSAIRAGADDYLTKRGDYWIHLPDSVGHVLDGFRSRTEMAKRPIRLLYVEHNLSDIELLRRHLLRHAPYIRLEALTSSAQALARLPAKGPVPDVDVLLLDFRLPGVDALDLLKEFNQIRRLGIPILIVSGQGTEEIAIQAVKLGAMDYLVKSADYILRLPLAVESVFYRSQAQKERDALRKSEARLRTIIQTEPECVLVADAKSGILELNPAGLAMLEADSLEDCRSRKLTDFVTEEYRAPFRALYAHVLAGKVGTLEFEIRGLKGTRRWLEIHAAAMRDPSGRAETFLGIILDATDRKRNEERMRQHEKMVAIGQLAGGIAHDFNNQLAAILGYAELLGARIENPEFKPYIETIIKAARRSGDLTKSLLAFSRQGQYQKVPIDIHRLILDTVEMLGRSLDKKIAIRLRLNASPATLLGDPTQIQNALLNLALNARDAMPEGGVLEFATETVAFDPPDFIPGVPDNGEGDRAAPGLPPGRYLHLSVTDSGSGMTREVKRRLFEPFFTTKPAGKGTGMGLASVFGTMGLHHGSVHVESEVGRGTTFHIHFPLFEEPSEPAASDEGSGEPVASMRILVVDDEEVLRSVLSDMLKHGGHSVLTAPGGREGLSIYREHWREIDLVILDMVMPDMNGLETLREILAFNPMAKVVLTSGYTQSDAPQTAKQLGALGFLSKPFDQSRLEAMLSHASSQLEKPENQDLHEEEA